MVQQYGGSSKIKNRSAMWSLNVSSRYRPQRVESRDGNKYLQNRVYSSIIHNRQKAEAAQVSTDGWTDEQSVVCAVGFHPASDRKEILTLTTKWMNLEGIMLSKISQTQRRNILLPWSHSHRVIRSVEIGNGMGVARMKWKNGRNWGVVEVGSYHSMEVLQCSRDGCWWWLHTSMNALNTKMIKMVTFMLYIFSAQWKYIFKINETTNFLGNSDSKKPLGVTILVINVK